MRALDDSVCYESQATLREMREALLGYSSQNLKRIGIREDFRFHFTVDEAEWYAQLLSLIDFIEAIPFAQIHEAAFPAWQQKDTWATVRRYKQKK
jgi:hypothetical protein